MSTALAGIIGVIAGALATSGMQLWISSRQRRNDALAACRLIWGVLETAVGILEAAVESRIWVIGTDGMERGLAVWNENRVAVARSVGAYDYRTLEVAFIRLRETVEQAGSFDEDGLKRVVEDPRLKEDFFWLRRARSVALRAGQTGWGRILDERKKKRTNAELAAELLNAELQAPGDRTDSPGAQDTQSTTESAS